MKLYCQECFAKVEYKFSKPKFCPECGKQLGVAASASSSVPSSNAIVKKYDDKEKIRELELELEQLKNQKASKVENFNKAISNRRINSYADSYEEDEEFQNEDDEYASRDFAETRQILNGFKRGKFKTGVSVEKNNHKSGISFKDLMDGVSSGAISVGDEFKMNETGPTKTEKQILEELKVEASSKPKLIQID